MNHSLAVDHLTDWSSLEWWLHYLGGTAVPLLATAFVVASYLMIRATVRLGLPNLLEATLGVILTACAFGAAFLSLNWHLDLMYATFRHTPSATRALLAGLAVSVLYAAVAVALAVKLGVSRRRQLAVIALACAVPVVFSLVGDGLNRSAISAARDAASADRQPLAGRNVRLDRSNFTLAAIPVLPRSPPAGRPGVHVSNPRSHFASHTFTSTRRPHMSTSLRTYGTAAVAAALLGAGSLLMPAVAMAQPLAPDDIIKIDSPELTVKVNGDTAQFTVTAPEDMVCVGPLIVEGSIDADDIDPENINEAFFEDLFDEAIWPTEEADLHAVVNPGSPLADQPGASVSPLKVSVPDLNDGEYVATSLCVTEDSVAPYDAADQISTYTDSQFPVQMHLRNFAISTTGSVSLGSVDVFGSLGNVGS